MKALDYYAMTDEERLDKITALESHCDKLQAPKTCETCRFVGYYSPHESLECCNKDCNFYSCDVDCEDGCNKHEPKAQR